MNARWMSAALLLVPQAAFAQGAILEDLADLRVARNVAPFQGAIPARVDLSAKIPPPRSQAATSTCVSWAATYGAASFALRARAPTTNVVLSPSFTYNQISRDQWCATGTTISATLSLLRDTGALPVGEFAFDAGWCGRLPTAAELERAGQLRIRSWAAFDAAVDGVRAQLARGVPVIFAMRSTSRMQSLRGDAVLEEDDVPGEGHAMLVVGHDDARSAFLVQNSAGPSWGTRGYGWFGYGFWKRNVRTAFVIE